MKRYYRVRHAGQPRHVVEENGEWRLVDGDIFAEHRAGAAIPAPAEGFLPPVQPSKILCVGLNYKDHAAEMNKKLPAEPLIFMKPSTAVIGAGEAIVLPAGAGRVDHEAEVGVVIGTRARHVREDEAHRHVLGITCVNDVTARELQIKDVQYTRGKGFDTFAPLGPCVAVGLDYLSAEGLEIEGWVNGTRRQSSSTRQLIFSIPKLIAFMSSVMTLLPGDVIATGTPSGVGPLQPGDRVTVKIQGVGELTNPVVARDTP